MSEGEVLEAIAEIARRKLGWDGELEPGMRLVEDLELDSIRLLTLAMEVEDHFRVCLDEDDEAAILTVADLVAVVRLKTSERAPEVRREATIDAQHSKGYAGGEGLGPEFEGWEDEAARPDE